MTHEPHDLRPASPARLFLPAAALLAVTFAAYLPAMRGDFLWDDDAHVSETPTLTTPGGLGRIWLEPTAIPQYYPLVHTTFWIEHRLWGLDTTGYHIVNILLHGLAAVLVWRVLARLGMPGAYLAGAIFALHPVQVESVAWITERKNVLSMVFYLLAAGAYLRFSPIEDPAPPRRWGWYAAAVALFVAALLSKTVTASLPAAVLLVVWWKRGRIARRDVWPLVPLFVIGAAFGLTTAYLEQYHVGAKGEEWNLSLVDRVLVAGRALVFYAGKLLWPANLTFIYERWEIDARQWWPYLYPAGVAAVVAALLVLRNRIGRGPLVAVLFFAGTLAPAIGFLNVFPFRYSFVADHFQYHASLGLIALGAAVLAWGVQRLGARGVRLGWVDAAILLAALGFLTWRQAHIYQGPEALWADTLAKNPRCWMAHGNLGFHYSRKGDLDRAEDNYRASLRIHPHDASMYGSLGVALTAQGKFKEAIESCREAIRLEPTLAEGHNNLGGALAADGRPDEATAAYREAVRLDPKYVMARYNLGTALAATGQNAEAEPEFREVLRLNPEHFGAHNNLAVALVAMGRVPEALEHYVHALRIKADYPEAHFNYATALARGGRLDEALLHLREAVRLKPDYAAAWFNLAAVLTKVKQVDEAVAAYRAAGRAWAAVGQWPAATDAAQRAAVVAQSAGKEPLAAECRREADAYRAGKPCPPASAP